MYIDPCTEGFILQLKQMPCTIEEMGFTFCWIWIMLIFSSNAESLLLSKPQKVPQVSLDIDASRLSSRKVLVKYLRVKSASFGRFQAFKQTSHSLEVVPGIFKFVAWDFCAYTFFASLDCLKPERFWIQHHVRGNHFLNTCVLEVFGKFIPGPQDLLHSVRKARIYFPRLKESWNERAFCLNNIATIKLARVF